MPLARALNGCLGVESRRAATSKRHLAQLRQQRRRMARNELGSPGLECGRLARTPLAQPYFGHSLYLEGNRFTPSAFSRSKTAWCRGLVDPPFLFRNWSSHV